MLTLGQAARLTGLGKTTLARAIKTGRLSAGRKEDGGYEIDPAELSRVYPFPAPSNPETVPAPVPAVHQATRDATTVMVAELRAVITDLRQDRDHWRSAFETQQRLLAGPTTVPEPVPLAGGRNRSPERTSLWRWLRSAG